MGLVRISLASIATRLQVEIGTEAVGLEEVIFALGIDFGPIAGDPE